MITYTQAWHRVADNCGFNPNTDSQSLENAKQDLNYALRKIKNETRRYWTRAEKTTNLVANQQYYTFPQDMVRITAVRVTSGALTLPIQMIDSEELWNRINLIPSMTVGIPTQGFIRGRNEVGLYPIPSTDYENGLIVSYETRMRDMNIDDTIPSVIVTQDSNVITAASGAPFTPNMVGMWFSATDGSDGNWYQIVGYTDTTHLTLENYYQGPSNGTGVPSIIGFVPDIPEDFHQALIDYACYRYYLKRKDVGTSADYKSLFDQALQEYKATYADKTTGVTQNDSSSDIYNLWNLPPANFSV